MMDILEINRMTLSNLYEQYPENFKDLRLEGNDLVYNGERIDISHFNINDLLSNESMFISSLSILSSEDIFKIIRLHALTINSSLNENKEKEEEKLEIIKKENPLFNNVSIVRRKNGVGYDEYINIVDSMGNDHLYRNDRNVDFLEVYENLKIRNGGNQVAIEDFLQEMNRKLPIIALDDARKLLDSNKTTEDFANKMNVTNAPYNDDNRVRVLGNEDDDIAIVRDDRDNSEHQVITYSENQFGDLVLEGHGQNVESDLADTSNKGTDSSKVTNNDEVAIVKQDKEEVKAILIAPEVFYRLLNSGIELSSEDRRNVDLYYAYLGDLILYEDYLLPTLRTILEQFRKYVFDLEYNNEGREINQLQQEAINKNKEMEESKALSNNEMSLEKKEEKVKKLELIRRNTNNDLDEAGSISTIQVIALVVGIAIILTAITLYLIK